MEVDNVWEIAKPQLCLGAVTTFGCFATYTKIRIRPTVVGPLNSLPVSSWQWLQHSQEQNNRLWPLRLHYRGSDML